MIRKNFPLPVDNGGNPGYNNGTKQGVRYKGCSLNVKAPNSGHLTRSVGTMRSKYMPATPPLTEVVMLNIRDLTIEELAKVNPRINGRLKGKNDKYVKHECIDCGSDVIGPLHYLSTVVGKRCNWCAYMDEC